MLNREEIFEAMRLNRMQSLLSRGALFNSPKKGGVRPNVLSGSSGGFDSNNTVFVVSDWGQSNSIGRGTAQRIIQLTTDKETPDGVKIYFKTDYTTADNGVFEPLQEGGNTREPDGSTGFSGAYGVLAARLKQLTPNNTVYIIAAGDGGTPLTNLLTSPDWNENSVAECFQIFTQRYYNVAYAKIVAENPGKTIVPIMLWHQGENDAADATATAQYAARFATFVPALRASHASLADALLIITKLHYNIDANEAAINAAFQAYADANSDLVKIIDISDINRKVDLTVGEKGGVATAGADDQHTSYLGQIAKANRAYTFIKARYAPNSDDSEIVTNAFDVSTISPVGIWLPLSRNYVTLGTDNTITGIQNLLSTGTFSTFTGPVKFKLAKRKGSITTLASTTPRIIGAGATGSTLIDGSFSVSFFLKPRDGQPAATNTIIHDIQNTASANLSRFGILHIAGGFINTFIAVNGTIVQAQTASAVFTDGGQSEEKHITLTYTNGGIVRIYVNGVLQTLDVLFPGDLSTIDLTAYVNATNPITLFATKTGAASFSTPYIGGIRQITFQSVVYSTNDIANLMLN
jgi:hypothetical protein